MATTTPKRLAGPLLIVGTASGSQTAALTVPAGHTYVVKQIILTNTSVAGRTITIGIGTTATLANLIASALALAASEMKTINTALVLTAAEVLNVFADTTNLVNITLVGWDYTA